MSLEGKVAWITGAGTGIGLAGAQALAKAGAMVVMSGRRADVLEREAGQIRTVGRQGRGRGAGRERPRAGGARSGRDPAPPRPGGHPGQQRGPEHPDRYWRNQTVESWDEVIRINLDGTFYAPMRCCRRCARRGRPGDQRLLLGRRVPRPADRRRLQRQQARGHRDDRDHQHGGVHQRHPRLRHLPGGGGDADPGSAARSAQRRGSRADAAAGGPGQHHPLGGRACRRTSASTRSSSARPGTGLYVGGLEKPKT